MGGVPGARRVVVPRVTPAVTRDAPGASGPRLLLNAEPFGFGPAAAVAILATELAPACAQLDYLGGGHTLDVQRRPPFHTVHAVTDPADDGALDALFASLAPRYDLFVTAVDFAMAGRALAAGLPVAIYDALAWYWPTVPEVAHRAALYLAQDFFGVRERLADDPALRARTVVVPPLAPPRRDRKPGRHVLVNLGGLQHPVWAPDDAVAYARLMLAAVRAGTPPGRRITVATSRGIARALDDPDVGTYDHDTVLDLMSTATYACMTSGLGNIYDAAAPGVPTLWPPPANDSQAEQIDLLDAAGHCDARLDWADLGLPVAYGPSIPDLTRAIDRAVREAATGHPPAGALARLVADRTAGPGAREGRARALAERFGHGGMRHAARAVLRWCAANRRAP